jgi:hypothetical protein
MPRRTVSKMSSKAARLQKRRSGGQLRQARFDFGRLERENNQWANGFAN